MKLLKKSYSFLLLSLVLVSCQEVIDVNLPPTEKTVVISGRVTDKQGTEVHVSSTAGYFDQGTTPKITDATVLLFEDGTMVSTLTTDTAVPGRYTSSFNGSIGHTYELEVQIPADDPYLNESTWHSKPELMKRISDADSLTVKYLDRTTQPAAFEKGYYALAYLQEPPGRGDRYRLRRRLNDSLFSQDLFLLTDENVDGLYFGKDGVPPLTVYGPVDHLGDTLYLEISSITDNYYDFLNLLANQVLNVGSTFDPPPAPIVGNIYREGNEKDYAYGFFAASAITSDQLILKP